MIKNQFFSALLFLLIGSKNTASAFFGGIAPNKVAALSKTDFISSLDTLEGINAATKERTRLVQALIRDNPTPRPGSTESFSKVAPGLWGIVYAPHISTLATWAGGGTFDPVWYQLSKDGSMVSHARFEFPWLPIKKSGWLSVSGTYSSQDEDSICRVDFDKAWVKFNTNGQDDEPYPTLEAVPPSLSKDTVNQLGKFFFVEQVSIFPVSYLDESLIVFDFELLGTRICARKLKG
jgi:hypothetical protein